jgi:hypothetical protein
VKQFASPKRATACCCLALVLTQKAFAESGVIARTRGYFVKPATSEQFLARALFEMRVLLASHIGGVSGASAEIREAAELAYAVHNLALASLEGSGFSLSEARFTLQSADARLGYEFHDRFFGEQSGAAG